MENHLLGSDSLGWGARCGAGTPNFSGVTSAAKCPCLLNWIHHIVDIGLLVPYIHPSYKHCSGFFKSLVIGFLLS